MPRMSKKKKLECALFLNTRNRMTYNELCRKCQRDCKQSFRVIVVECPKFLRKERKRKNETWNYKTSEIEVKSVEWFWYPYIPYGKVTVIQGDSGDGKSTFILKLAAMLTKGEPMPFTDWTGQEPVNVMYVSPLFFCRSHPFSRFCGGYRPLFPNFLHKIAAFHIVGRSTPVLCRTPIVCL